MANTTTSNSHPRGLYLLFFTEMWERFSYYGMRAIFILFLTKALLIQAASASNIYGSFTGLVYLTPLIGGYISDRFWGNRRSILVGGILMAIGQFMMFFSGNIVTDGQQSASAISMMWGGLTFLIIGNGFFKPNISTMVGQLYPKGDHRIDGAFTIFYMGINLGAFFSPLVCGTLGDTGNIHDFRWGFFAAGVGMIVSTISFELLKNKLLVTPEGKPIGMPKSVKANELSPDSPLAFEEPGIKESAIPKFQTMGVAIWVGVAVILGVLFYTLCGIDVIGSCIFSIAVGIAGLIITDKSLNKEERERIMVIFILAFFVIFFWSCFEQAGASLTLFADTQVKRNITMHVPGYVILGVALILEYFLMKAFAWFFEWKKNIALILQVTLGILLIALFIAGYIPDFIKNEFPASWFQSVNPLGIIVLAPLFTVMWNALSKQKLEPSSPMKMAFGLLLLALGYVVIAYGVHGVDSKTKISMWFLIALYVLHTMGELSLSPIGLSMVSKLAPLRFASLLMGTWFLANAAANKFAGTLSALLPPGAGEEVAKGPVKIPTFLGIEISNLFTFFCVFIVLSGTASLLLFGLYKWLEKRMHGIK